MFSVFMFFVCLAGMIQNSSAEELAISITPVFDSYLLRTMPWTSEEKVMVQCDISGLEANEKKENIHHLKMSLLQDGEVLVSKSQQSAWSNGKLTVVFFFGPLNSGNYSVQISVDDKISGKTAVKEMPFEIGDEKDFRLLYLTFFDPMKKYPLPPVCFAHQPVSVACACSSTVQEGDDVSITVFDKESSEVLGTYHAELPHSMFYVTFQLSKPGKNVLLVKAVDKTKNLEVEYELPVFVVDPNEIMK